MTTDNDIENVPGLPNTDWERIANESAFQLMQRFKRDVVRAHVRRRRDSFSCGVAEAEKLCLDHYEVALRVRDQNSANLEPELGDFVSDISVLHGNLRFCTYLSGTKQHPFASRFGSRVTNGGVSSIQPIEDAYYIAETTLRDEILFLPQPESLDDVLRMREAKEIHRFRQVLPEWCDAISNR